MLGCLWSQLKFKVSLREMKRNLFVPSAPLVTKYYRANPETVELPSVNSYVQNLTCYAVESFEFSHTAVKQLQASWVCALCQIFHIKGRELENVRQMCNSH